MPDLELFSHGSQSSDSSRVHPTELRILQKPTNDDMIFQSLKPARDALLIGLISPPKGSNLNQADTVTSTVCKKREKERAIS